MTRGTTPDRILEAAEVEFGRCGYAGMTMRGVAREARCNLASANYHFGSKEQLVVAMLKRRIEPLNAIRMERLVAARAKRKGKRIALEELFGILLRPLGDTLEPDGKLDRSFLQMLSRSLTDPSEFIQSVHQSFFQEMKTEFGREIAAHFPKEPAEEIAWKIMIAGISMIGSIVLAPTMPRFLRGSEAPLSIHDMIERMIPFLTAGIRADLASGAGKEHA